MARWMKILAVALAAVVGAVPAFPHLSQAPAPSEPILALPSGEELSDYELALAEGGQPDPITLIARMAVGATIGAGIDLFRQGVEIALGVRSEVDPGSIGKAAGAGAFAALLPQESAVRVVRSAIVTGARWTARAVAAVGSAAVTAAEKTAHVAVSIGQRIHEGLHTVHVALHNYIREPVGSFFRGAWEWLTGR